MPLPFIAQLGQQAAGNAVQAGMGLLLQSQADKRQMKQQEKLQELQMKGQKEMTNYNTAKQLQMWKDTNYPAQVEQLQKAGLNPGLLYGMSGGGGTTANISQGSVDGGKAPQGGREIQDMIGMGIQSALLIAQKENIEADTEKKKIEAAKTAGVDTKNVAADTENKILQGIILDYTGKEAKETFEQVTSPNRSIQAKTYEDELAARQGVAGTIYELWTEGKLKDKSLAEIEGLLLANAKTREETKKIYKDIELLEQNIKGAKLNNIITELESKLQTETGIDRNSPTWFKILGRLFVTLFNK